MILPAAGLLLSNLLIAMVLAFVIGQWYRRLPEGRLDEEGWLLELRPFERDGRWYEDCLRIKAWKDHLPETGGIFGGVSKRSLPSGGDHGLHVFVAECRRGERTHWGYVAVSPVFLLVHRDQTGVALSGVAASVNAPFIAVLRYNRARIVAIVARRRGD